MTIRKMNLKPQKRKFWRHCKPVGKNRDILGKTDHVKYRLSPALPDHSVHAVSHTRAGKDTAQPSDAACWGHAHGRDRRAGLQIGHSTAFGNHHPHEAAWPWIFNGMKQRHAATKRSMGFHSSKPLMSLQTPILRASATRTIRIISARRMTRQERQAYER
jgi:hypothetical protein